ncbi:MAG: ABC-three component system protein [Microgenomates group bacterium]
MDKEKLHIARLIFENRIYQYDGSTFETFFTNVMCLVDSGFEPVKPHGKVGDRKNDGFNKPSGIYYQVYAPEDKTKYSQIHAIAKAEQDFKGLIDYWDKIAKIKTYRFVINDKYKGAFPEVQETLSRIGKNHTILCETWLAKDLEKEFVKLKEEDMMRVIGPIPSSVSIDIINYNALTDAVNFLMKNASPNTYSGTLPNPKFDEKIKFNDLSDSSAHLLNIGNYQASVVNDFFSRNSNDSRQHLSEIFHNLYNKGEEIVPNTDDKRSDRIFFYILDSACPPNKNKSIQDAVLVLMAYYFEACDIFKEPK